MKLGIFWMFTILPMFFEHVQLGSSENHYPDFRWKFMLHHYPVLGKVELPTSSLDNVVEKWCYKIIQV